MYLSPFKSSESWLSKLRDRAAFALRPGPVLIENDRSRAYKAASRTKTSPHTGVD